MMNVDREAHAWRKSSRSSGNSQCVEVAHTASSVVLLRDSKNPDGPRLAFTPAEWTAFVGGIKDGEFDL